MTCGGRREEVKLDPTTLRWCAKQIVEAFDNGCPQAAVLIDRLRKFKQLAKEFEQ
jgi:hypothetical protein